MTTQQDHLDSVLLKLGAKGRYQVMQMMFCAIGGYAAAFQLYGNIFIGKDIPYKCASPPLNVTNTSQLYDVEGNSSHVLFDQCSIVVTSNSSDVMTTDTYDCLHGIDYEWDEQASFVSEFDLVCGSYLLVSLAQTFVVLGQGIGAFTCSILSDRFGRKPVLVGSQLGLFLVGVAIAASPSFPFLAFFKCLVGIFQQGVVTGIATMGIELFPREQRSLCALIVNMWWAVGACSMALFAYVLRAHSWRVLQYTLSSVSLMIAIVQFFFVEESLRWLVDNGKKTAVVRLLTKAARANGKDLDSVLDTLRQCQQQQDSQLLVQDAKTRASSSEEDDEEEGELIVHGGEVKVAREKKENGHSGQGAKDLKLAATRKLTLLDMFRHPILRRNALLTFLAWFTVAFVVFTLYLMSTSFAGDPYLNYFLTAFMEVPPSIMLFLGVDKLGRKRTVQGFYAIAGVGCIASAICKMFPDISAMETMSAVFAMLGMVGGSGAFGGLFFYTPEYFPTNFRNQALGTGSTVGRIGGMIAPFMKNLALIVVWGPGAISGTLCVLVVLSVHFLPETRGRELPTEIADIEAWYRPKAAKDKALTAKDVSA